MNKTFQITSQLVDESTCGSPRECVLANIFNELLPENYFTRVSFGKANKDFVRDEWCVELNQVENGKYIERGFLLLPINLIEIAESFDQLGHESFYKQFGDRVFEYPENFLEFVEKVNEEAK